MAVALYECSGPFRHPPAEAFAILPHYSSWLSMRDPPAAWEPGDPTERDAAGSTHPQVIGPGLAARTWQPGAAAGRSTPDQRSAAARTDRADREGRLAHRWGPLDGPGGRRPKRPPDGLWWRRPREAWHPRPQAGPLDSGSRPGPWVPDVRRRRPPGASEQDPGRGAGAVALPWEQS
ncbi:hypothetical protein NDU88_002563 [Pleurodeles waltl]|uniref:Uncharacterized protein n=1 Tax=Pleurodeles waltl TaxID=8319 RepID=A0AAV7SE09_PLEWA|nr:hypothetical protein NDU88_002563 [Pleurodeles waltl]